MLSQELKILRDLNRGKRITPMSALRDYGCWALSSRVSDLNKRLESQSRNRISVKMITRKEKTYAEYFIPASERAKP